MFVQRATANASVDAERDGEAGNGDEGACACEEARIGVHLMDYRSMPPSRRARTIEWRA